MRGLLFCSVIGFVAVLSVGSFAGSFSSVDANPASSSLKALDTKKGAADYKYQGRTGVVANKGASFKSGDTDKAVQKKNAQILTSMDDTKGRKGNDDTGYGFSFASANSNGSDSALLKDMDKLNHDSDTKDKNKTTGNYYKFNDMDSGWNSDTKDSDMLKKLDNKGAGNKNTWKGSTFTGYDNEFHKDAGPRNVLFEMDNIKTHEKIQNSSSGSSTSTNSASQSSKSNALSDILKRLQGL